VEANSSTHPPLSTEKATAVTPSESVSTKR
jgi:hypothetical protein